uniref:SCP domain-containing protein n=2 Tax=Strongyloides stercoralis TaxID=6248 RepID=A0AAF5I0D8_STRER
MKTKIPIGISRKLSQVKSKGKLKVKLSRVKVKPKSSKIDVHILPVVLVVPAALVHQVVLVFPARTKKEGKEEEGEEEEKEEEEEEESTKKRKERKRTMKREKKGFKRVSRFRFVLKLKIVNRPEIFFGISYKIDIIQSLCLFLICQEFYRKMWSKSSLLIAIFALFGFLTLCSGFSYQIRQVIQNGESYFIYNGRRYGTFEEAMNQVRKDMDEYFNKLTRKPSIIWITRTPKIQPLPVRTTPRPNKPVRPVSKTTRRPQPPKPNPRPSSRIPPKPVKPATQSTTKPVVTQKPPNNRIDRKYIPSAAEVDKLYTFDVNKEKLKDSSGPFSDKVYDEVWRGYDYKKDFKTGYLDMRNRILKETNRYRQAHGVPPLTYDYDLEKASQEYAKYLGDYNLFEHDPKNREKGWGENLARLSASIGSLATKKWYDEVRMHDFSKNQFSYGTGHFTALVWKDTKKVGCGIYLKTGNLYVVCKYTPGGNVYNKFNQNVFPRRGQ